MSGPPHRRDGSGSEDVEAFCRALWRREEKIVEKLKARVDPNGRDRWGNTPLLMAVQYADLSLVEALVRRGATVDQERAHLTPITYAARRKAGDIVGFLRARAAHESVVTWIYLGERKRVTQALEREAALAALRDEAATPILHHAAEAQDDGMVALLLDHGAAIGETDGNGETALHRIADPQAKDKRGVPVIDSARDPALRALLASYIRKGHTDRAKS